MRTTRLSHGCVLPSRDREGAISLRLRHPNRHRLPLPFNHIANCSINVVPIPQPACTSMSRPPLSIRTVGTALVQSPARVGFEITHHPVGFRIGVYNCMHVRGPNVPRQKGPVPMRANLPYSVQNCVTFGSIQQVRSMLHQVALARSTLPIGLQQTMSRNIVVPIHGTRFISMQMAAMARERNQVRHERSFYTASSRSRLGRNRSLLVEIVQHYKHIPRFL